MQYRDKIVDRQIGRNAELFAEAVGELDTPEKRYPYLRILISIIEQARPEWNQSPNKDRQMAALVFKMSRGRVPMDETSDICRLRDMERGFLPIPESESDSDSDSEKEEGSGAKASAASPAAAPAAPPATAPGATKSPAATAEAAAAPTAAVLPATDLATGPKTTETPADEGKDSDAGEPEKPVAERKRPRHVTKRPREEAIASSDVPTDLGAEEGEPAAPEASESADEAPDSETKADATT